MTTKTKTECRTKGLCHYDALTRTKFFHGMLLTDDHLRAEQTYHREALKRINRHLWGSGIVCGLEVKKTSGLCIKVHPGLALDCHGNVIDVCKCITIDLSEQCKKEYPDDCAPTNARPITKYLVLRYVEIPADPEPVLTPDDECTAAGEGTKCEASKYREGFCLEFWHDCPNPEACPDEDKYENGLLASYWQVRGTANGEDRRLKMEKLQPDCMASPPCPECGCPDSAVGLAKLVIDCVKNDVDVTCECRQYVWSPLMLRWLICHLLARIDEVPKEAAGLDTKARHLPNESVAAARPLQAMWLAVTEYAFSGDRFGQLQEHMHALESRCDALDLAIQASKAKRKDKEQ